MLLGFGDPVADAIGLLRPRTTIGHSLLAGGTWAARFDGFPHVKVGLVVRGTCWLTLDGHEPVLLEEGDFYLLSDPSQYVLSSTPSADPRTVTPLREDPGDRVVRIGAQAGEDTYVCDGQFVFDDANASVLTNVLPPFVHVPATDPHGEHLALVQKLLVAEFEAGAAGGSLVLDRLGEVLLVHMLRAHASRARTPFSWLCALNADGIGTAMRAMHEDLSHAWTLQELADISHMSRSAFARSFKDQVGVPPLEYLIHWRMRLAREALRQNTMSISELASRTGYRSESAFSTAFRRVVGVSPKKFRDRARQPDRQPAG